MPNALSGAGAARIANRLSAWFGQTGKRGIGARTQIIDPRLCADVLKRLGPSLEQHKGCDLIDVNPGIGLWSEHLHKVLKPRRHILVEPDRDFFDPYLKPYLAKYPGRIEWTDKSLKDVIHESSILGENEAPRHEQERMTFTNNKILLNINLAGPCRVRGKVFGRQDQYLWNNLYASFLGLRDDLWHRGLFRTLAWVADEQKYGIVPRASNEIQRQGVEFELAATVSEIAGAPALTNDPAMLKRRIFDIEKEDRNLIHKVDSETYVSDTRTDLPPIPPAVHLHPEVEVFQNTEHNEHFEYLDRLIKLDQRVQKSDPALYEKFAPTWKDMKRRSKTRDVSDPTVKEWLRLYGLARTTHTQYMTCLKLINDQRVLEQEWRATPDDTHPKIPSFKARATAINTALNNLRANDGALCRRSIDDYRLLDNRATHWYRRTDDPLIVHPREFAHEHSPLALLDIQPSPQFRAKFDTDLRLRCFDHVLPRLLNRPSQDIYSCIERELISGGINEFLETIPSLTDVRKGGWYDLKTLRVRSLPPQLWEDIILAYEAWPFRASFESMSFANPARSLNTAGKLN